MFKSAIIASVVAIQAQSILTGSEGKPSSGGKLPAKVIVKAAPAPIPAPTKVITHHHYPRPVYHSALDMKFTEAKPAVIRRAPLISVKRAPVKETKYADYAAPRAYGYGYGGGYGGYGGYGRYGGYRGYDGYGRGDSGYPTYESGYGGVYGGSGEGRGYGKGKGQNGYGDW